MDCIVPEREARHSESYLQKGETDLFSNEKLSESSETKKFQRDTAVVVRIDKDIHSITATMPLSLRDRWAAFRGKYVPLLEVHSTYVDEPKPAKTVFGESNDGTKRSGTNFSGANAHADNDIAVRLLKGERTTKNKAFLKAVKKESKARQEVVYKLPRGFELSREQKKEFLKILDDIVLHRSVKVVGHIPIDLSVVNDDKPVK